MNYKLVFKSVNRFICDYVILYMDSFFWSIMDYFIYLFI